jgi:hypothetical protein
MIRPLSKAAVRLMPSAFFALSLIPTAPAFAGDVANSATPSAGIVEANLDELFHLGGFSEADEEFFGVVANGILGADGETYLLDEQLCEIRVFDAEGQYLNTFGREGEGPGEFRQAQDLLLLPSGKVGVIYGQQNRLATYGLDGTIGEDTSLLPDGVRFAFLIGAQSRDGRMVIQQHATELTDDEIISTMSMVGLDASGEVTHTYFSESSTQKRQGPGISISIDSDDYANAWVLMDGGFLAINDSGDEYKIEILDAQGELVRTITRDYEPLRRSDEELERLEREQRERAEESGGRIQGDEIDPLYGVILSMHVGPDGQLWVMTGRGRFGEGIGENTLGTFDVFGPEGDFVRQVSIDVPFMGGSDEFEFLGDRLYVYEESRNARQSMYAGFGMEIITDQETDDDIDPLTIWCWKVRLPSS